MVQITVNLSPPLTGAQSKLYLVVGDVVYPVIDLPPSANGIISISIGVSSPDLDYAVIFPAQTVEGVAYLETMSTVFNLLSDVTLNMILEPVTEPEPPTPPSESMMSAIGSAVTGIVLIVLSI